MRSKRVLSGLFFLLAMALGGAAEAAGKCPNMLILLDRSGSMWGAKWDAARTAIRTFSEQRQSFMRFGLAVFPAVGDDCGAGGLQVHSDFYSAEAINNGLDTMKKPSGSTPTGDAILMAGQTPDMLDAQRGRFLILVTDGDPTCPDINDGEGNLALAEARIADLNRQGIKTFVIGFGTQASPDKLDRMALAGGTGRAGATCDDPHHPGTKISCRYYEALDNVSLTTAFDAIARVATGELSGGKSCDDSCYVTNGCASGQRCVKRVVSYSGGKYQLNLGQCESDPCLGVSCDESSFCRDGKCIRACTGGCEAGKSCEDGVCVTDPCLQPGACACSAPCPKHLECAAGQCVDSACRNMTCPASAPFCDRGNCYAGTPAPADEAPSYSAGVPIPKQPAARPPPLNEFDHQGCSCGASGADLVLFALAAAPGLLLRRRRKSA